MARFVVLAVILAVALADSPHYFYANSRLGPNYALSVDFKEAGLGNSGFDSVDETLTAHVTITELCINGGSNHPSAANKRRSESEIRAVASFPIRNGQTTGTLTSNGLPQLTRFCPPGQDQVLCEVAYANIRISDPWGTWIQAPANQCWIHPACQQFVPEFVEPCP